MHQQLTRIHPSNLPEPLNIGMDLDGVEYVFDRAWWLAGVKLGRIDPTVHDHVPATRWEFYEALGFDLDGFLALCHDAADAGLLWHSMSCDEGAGPWRLLASEHNVHVKTDRSFGSHPAVSESATVAWLNVTGRPYTSITFTNDKTTGPAVDLMLDDKLENYDALDAAGVEVWLLDRPWNWDDSVQRRRVFSREEFITRVDVAHYRRYLAAQAAAIEGVGV